MNRRQHTRVTETYTTTPNDTSGESAFNNDSEVFSWSVSGASSPYNIIQISVLVVSAFCLTELRSLIVANLTLEYRILLETCTDQVRYL